MMFSVVIPCHDRIDLLKDAVYTVLQQDFNDWELVIFDNASTGDIAGYVKELRDPRVRYERSEKFLPVTDSWNRAINMAVGDHVIFLGDDDGLTPQYFSRMIPIIEKFEKPEVVYCAIYQFIHPGVAPWASEGYVADVKNGFFFVGRDKPFLLSPEQALKAVEGSVSLRRNFTFNIQAFVFSKTFLQRLKQDGAIFRSPFPDYYMANVALLKAQSVVVVPDAMSIAGVSKASFGYTLFNELEEKGEALLNGKLTSDALYGELERFFLPGPLYHTNYVMTMEHVVRYVRAVFHHKVDFARYRRLQIYTMLLRKKKQGLKACFNPSFWRRLSFAEKIWMLGVFSLIKLSKINKRFSRNAMLRVKNQVEPYAFKALERVCAQNHYTRSSEVFDAMRAGTLG
ncbi:MAG: glycosyltransferase family 2 protein [bacterium]